MSKRTWDSAFFITWKAALDAAAGLAVVWAYTGKEVDPADED
jgi:hypothetical protein